MKALLIIAHGSRKLGSNNEIRRLTRKVAKRADDSFALIDCAFLELAEPDIQTAMASLVERGATDILAVPYFLARGTHVANDIPDEIRACQSAHPQVRISISDYLGASDLVSDAVLDLARAAG